MMYQVRHAIHIMYYPSVLADELVSMTVLQWTSHFPLASGEAEKTVCEGSLQPNSNRGMQAGKVNAVNDQTYCDAELFPKEYVEDYNL